MAEDDRPRIRVWRWADLSPAGQRAYVLMSPVKLLRSRDYQVRESWVKEWVDAARSMKGDEPTGGDVSDGAVCPDGVDSEPRLNAEDWARIGSMSSEAPMDLLMIHKAAIEFVVGETGNPIPAGLVEITQTLVDGSR